MDLPAPPQPPHVVWNIIDPCLIVWKPEPPQVPQLVSPVPGWAPVPLHLDQLSTFWYFTVF
jgi:hypothetical protein